MSVNKFYFSVKVVAVGELYLLMFLPYGYHRLIWDLMLLLIQINIGHIMTSR